MSKKLYDQWKKNHPNASDKADAVVREQYGIKPDTTTNTQPAATKAD